MQAIITRYVCPTNFRGSRISARCQAKRIIVEWDHALNPEENHKAACDALCKSLDASCQARYGADFCPNWTRPKVSGQLHDGSYAHVFLP
jgi:hypothetical protein